MAGIVKRPRPPRRRISVGLVVAALLIVVIPSALAQTGAGTPVASGEFTGSIGLDGGFSVAIEDGELVVLVNGTGPLELTLTDGTMTGKLTLPYKQTLSGEFGGGTITMTGEGSGTMSGQMSGPPGNYTMTGTNDFTNTVSVTVSGITTQSATSSSTDPVAEPLTDVIVLCDDIVGRWDLRAKQEIQGAGFNEFIRGYFSASTGVDATEQAAAVESLMADISSWAGSVPSVDTGGTSLYIGRGLALLSQAQTLQAQLAAPTPCPPDPTFMTALTLAAQDAMNTFVDRYPGFTTPAVVSLALGSGAIGEGSPAPDGAASLQAKMEAAVNETFDTFVNDPSTNDADIVNMARSGQMLGMETMGSSVLSPGEVLLVYGAE